MTAGKLQGPVVDQILERFLGGTPLKFSGVQLHIAGRLLTLRIESDDALQKVFEGTADERLEDARAALDKLLAASPAVRQAAAPLQRRYVLIERFSSREICDKLGDDGDIRWKPGYPSDTNLGAGEEERGEIAEAAERLKTPLAGPMVNSFIKGAAFDKCSRALPMRDWSRPNPSAVTLLPHPAPSEKRCPPWTNAMC